MLRWSKAFFLNVSVEALWQRSPFFEALTSVCLVLQQVVEVGN
jgi:hypothetical protein